MIWLILASQITFTLSVDDMDYCPVEPVENAYNPNYPNCEDPSILYGVDPTDAYNANCQCTRSDKLNIYILGPTDPNVLCRDGEPAPAFMCTCENGHPKVGSGCLAEDRDQCDVCDIAHGLVNDICEPCEYGFFQAQQNFSEPCIPWSPCGYGEFQTGGSNIKDTSCEFCPENTFQSDSETTARTCTEWKKCNAGFRRIAGTVLYDASCVECTTGQFQPLNNTDVEKCTPWRADSCPLGERYDPGTKKIDATCETNICTCNNGTAATGVECLQDGDHTCASCDIGFKFEGVTCIPKYPIECTPEKISNKALARTSYPFGTASQLSFAKQSPFSSPSDGSQYAINYASIGTVWTQKDMSGLYNPRGYTSSTLYAFVQDSTWKKGNVQVKQDQLYTFEKPATNINAVKRTNRVWVDRPSILTTYTLQDEDGSFRVKKNGLSVTLAGGNIGSSTCSNNYIHNTNYRHLGTCQLQVPSSIFQSLTQDETRDVSIKLMGQSGATPIEKTLTNVIVTKPPNWYDSTFRSSSVGTRASTPDKITTSSFLTLPTHAVYADSSISDTFTAVVFVNNNAHPGFAWTFELKYDQSRIAHQSVSVSSDFKSPTVGINYVESDGQKLLTFMSTGPSTAGEANENRRKGVYYVMSITFKFIAGTANGVHEDLMSLKLVSLVNSGSNAFVVAESAQIADRRDTTDAGLMSGQMEVYSNDEIGILPYHSLLGEPMFDTSKLNGETQTTDFGGTIIKSYHLSAHHSSRAYKSAQLSSCSKVSGTDGFETSIVSRACRITYDSETTQVIGFEITEGAFTSDTIVSKITVPETITIEANDFTLNQIQSIDCSTTQNKYPFQSTKIRVIADGLDVTSLATGMISTSPTVANFKTSSNSEYDAYIQGKSEGTTTIQLFSGSQTFSNTITVSATPVSVSDMYNRVITDVSFQTSPIYSHIYPSTFDSEVLVQQILTQPPLGTTKAHYGYLFTTVVFSDGTEEYILGDEISTSKTTTNIVWTQPGGTDSTVSALSIQNDYSDRWMVSVAPNPYLECIMDTAKATWTKCGTDIITKGVPLLIFPPAPVSIEFKIVKTTLAPNNDPASHAPFNLPTSSTFTLKVTYDDGSIIPFESESNVIFYTDENSCGTVTNDETDSIAINEGATCNSVNVYVNVTFGEVVFQAAKSSVVAKLDTVVTSLKAFPSGTSNINSLHTLPCVTSYEKGTLSTIGTLSTGTSKTITQYMTYTIGDPNVASVSGSVITPQSAGSTSAGNTADIDFQGALDNVVVSPCTFQIFDETRSIQSYGGSWSLSDHSTVSKTKDSTVSTTFTLSYTDTDNVYFSYYNFFKTYTYFDPTDILEFRSEASEYLTIDQIGTITQKQNYHEKIALSVHHKCSDADVWTKHVWSNLLPNTEDVDMGTDVNNYYAPYYFTSGSSMNIHIWANPASGRYVRGLQVKVTLPDGMTSDGASFVANPAPGFSSSASFNVEGTQIMGLTSTHSATVPYSGKIRLGYFSVPVTGSGLLDNYMSVQVISLQSDTKATDGASGNVRSTKQDFFSTAAYARVFVGTPSRRLFSVIPKHLPIPTIRRKLTTCNPCTDQIFGDVDGDCVFNVNDVTAAQTFATMYSPFSTGAITVNPLTDWINANGYYCAWVKQQLNPTLDLLDGNLGGDNPGDVRYQQPRIDSLDAIHLARATQYQHRFVVPSVDCVVSSEALGFRPDLFITAEVYGGVGQDVNRIKSSTQTNSVGTDVYFEVVIANNAQNSQQFTVTRGTHVTSYANPYNLYDMGADVQINPSGSYSRASGSQAGILVKATYDATLQKYVAQLQPNDYSGDVQYYAAVAVETKMNSKITDKQTQSFIGLGTFPYSEAGKTFEPVLGSPYSTIRKTSLECIGCPAGQHRLEHSSTVTPECIPCGAKTFQSVAGSITSSCKPWKKCAPGEKWSAGTASSDAKCEPCESGRFQEYDQSEFEECTEWSTCDKGFGADVHSAIKDIECQVCAAGQYQPLDSTTNFCGDWKKCNKGYRRVNGSTIADATCHECATGQFQPNDNVGTQFCTVWTLCNKGYRREIGSTIADATCHGCATGQFQPNDDEDTQTCTEWTLCNKGYRRVDGSTIADATCHECASGQFQLFDESISKVCDVWTLCPAGFRREIGSTIADATCHECATGQFQPNDDEDTQTCTEWALCNKGYRRVDGSTIADATCHGCTYGKYQPNNSSDSEICIPWVACQQGSGIKEVTTVKDVECVQCIHGQYQPNDNFIYTCAAWKKCNKGYRRVSGSTIVDATCHGCATGRFQPNDNVGTQFCTDWKLCNKGYRREIGSTIVDATCHGCATGRFQPNDDEDTQTCTEWTLCNKGYRRVDGSTIADATCHECASGQFQPNDDEDTKTCTIWDTCNVGHLRIPGSTTVNAQCQDCQVNYIQPDGQSTAEECTQCQPGKRSNEVRSECLQNTCVCGNGTVATGSLCTVNDGEICVACDDGFRLQGDKSCEQIYPPRCAPNALVKDVDAVAEYIDGSSSQLTFADSGLCSDSDPVTIQYGFNSNVIACPGTHVTVVWQGRHNIQEMESAECLGIKIGDPISGYEESGISREFKNDELTAQPGQRRFFKCDQHCGNTESRFEIYCPPIPLTSDVQCTLSNTQSQDSGTGYSSLGVLVSQTRKTLYIPPKDTSATLYAHVQDFRWRKSNSNVYQHQSATGTRIAAHAIAVLRTKQIWIDRPNVYSAYSLQDAGGSFVVDTASLSSKLEISGVTGTSSCSTSKLHRTLYRHMDSCSFVADSSSFLGLDSDTTRSVVLTTEPQAHVGSFATNLPSIILTRPPNWYDSTLRSTTTGTRSYTTTSITTSSFVTLPTHPVYADSSFTDEFEAIVFINNDAHVGESWTFELKYDASLVTYNGYSVSADFSTPSVSSTTSGKWTVKTFLSPAPTASGSATPSRRRGIYYAMSLRFEAVSNLAVGIKEDTMSLKLVNLINPGNNAFVVAESSSFLDHRDVASSVHTHGQINIYENENVGLLPYHSSLGGAKYDTSKLDGETVTDAVHGTVIKSYQLASFHSRAYATTSITSCDGVTHTDSYTLSVSNNMCQISYSSTSTISFSLKVTSGELTSGELTSKIVVPSIVTIKVSDTLLNKISSLDCSGEQDTYAYQSAKVVVLADGLDVSSLASNMISANSDVIDFKSVDSLRTHRYIQGKQIGTTHIKLFSGSTVESPPITVTSTPVSVSDMENRIVTDIVYQTRPPSSLPYSSASTSQFLIRQVLTQPPLGTTKAHFGYLFTKIVYSDGAEEYISGDEIKTSSTSSNMVWTAPGESDTSVSTLVIANDYSDRWMVSVARNALTECIRDSADATWSRCGTDLVTRGVPMLINPPFPVSVSLQINHGTLSPLNDPATASPFSLPSSSTFTVSVTYEDGAVISSFASENNVVYYVDENSCGTVTNSNIDTVSVNEHSTCSSILVRVNVTFGDVVLQADDTSVVAVMTRLDTKMSAYPSGSTDISDLYQLPCVASFERGTLSTTGTLSTGSSKSLTSSMSYASSNTGVGTVSSRVVIPVAQGQVTFGRQEELGFPPSVHMTNVVVTPCIVAVHNGARIGNVYSTDWSLSDDYTVAMVKDSTMSTSVEFKYVDSSSVAFEYDNVFTDYNYFVASDILKFSSDNSQYISIASSGTITQLDNHHEKIVLTMSLACNSDESWSVGVWSNLIAGPEDVDMGTYTNNNYAPYYIPSSHPSVNIHIWANPRSNEYLRGIQVKVTLPNGMTSVGASFTGNAPAGYLHSASFNVEGSSIMGLTSTHSSTVSSKGTMYLGYFTVPLSGSGLLGGSMSVEVVSIQSDTHATDGASGNVRSSRQGFGATAAAARVYVGANLQRKSPLKKLRNPPARKKYPRKLSACDPCTANIFGDVDGDCVFNVNDVTAAQTFATKYSAFATGTVTENPLLTWENANGYDCDWVKQQLNPTLDLLDDNFGGNDIHDVRYLQPKINAQDAIHLSRATQFMNRFIVPSVSCQDSTADYEFRPHLKIEVSVYGGVGQDTQTVISNTQTSAVGTEVYFEVVIGNNATDKQLFNITKGTQMTKYANPYNLYDSGPDVDILSSGSYSKATGKQAGIILKAVYEEETQTYVAQLQPFDYTGDVRYYVAVAVETKMNNQITDRQTQAFSGLSTFPYSQAGFTFEPVLGSPYSAVLRNYTECKFTPTYMYGYVHVGSDCTAKCVRWSGELEASFSDSRVQILDITRTEWQTVCSLLLNSGPLLRSKNC